MRGSGQTPLVCCCVRGVECANERLGSTAGWEVQSLGVAKPKIVLGQAGIPLQFVCSMHPATNRWYLMQAAQAKQGRRLSQLRFCVTCRVQKLDPKQLPAGLDAAAAAAAGFTADAAAASAASEPPVSFGEPAGQRPGSAAGFQNPPRQRQPTQCLTVNRPPPARILLIMAQRQLQLPKARAGNFFWMNFLC